MTRIALLALFCAGVIFAQPAIIQGPVVDAITYSSARISWVTDVAADSTVRYGLNALDVESTDATLDTVHSWYASGLAPGTTYRFRVCSKPRGGPESCSDERTLTTESVLDSTPRLPEPPREVDTSMPTGDYGEAFVIDEACSNLPDVLQSISRLEGDLNYEIRVAPRTTCAGLWVFPDRPNHRGWIVVTTTGSLPPAGIRVGPGDTAEMARFVTNALPGQMLSLVSFPAACVPGSFMTGRNAPGMPVFVCSDQGNSGGPKPIGALETGESVIVTAPGHGYRTGNLVRVAETRAGIDNVWRITVLDDNRFALDGARVTRAYSGGGTVARNDAWTQVPHFSGEELPTDCTPNDFFLRTDRPPLEGVYWCTSQGVWTHVRPGSYTQSVQIAALQFAPGASRYRFIGVEVTHIPVPNPPPADWSRPDYKQGNFGSLITTNRSNDRIIFDRCDIHGLDYPARLGRAIYLNGSNVALINSRVHKVSRWIETSASLLESGAVDIGQGPGPGILENNFLEAIGITVFFPDSSRHYLPPADYVIRRNFFSHPETYLPGSPKNWSGKNYNNRQVIELKAGRRVLVEGNILDGNWADETQGAMVLLTPRFTAVAAPKNIVSIEDGVLRVTDNATVDPYTPGLLVSVQGAGSGLDGIWEVAEVLGPTTYRLANIPAGSASGGRVLAVTNHMQISDIDIRNNIFRNGPNLLWMNGHDTGRTTRTTQRVRFHNNLVYGMDVRSARDGGRVSPISSNRDGRSGVGVFAAFGMEDLIVTNNTIFDFKGKGPTFLFFDSTRYGAHAGLLVRDNIFTADKATVASISAAFPGAAALDRQWTHHPDPKWIFRNNVLCCDIKTKSPSDNMWPDTVNEIGFLNPPIGALQIRGDSRYQTAGTFGGPVGVNVPELENALGQSLDAIISLLAKRAPAAGERYRARTRP